MTIDVGTELSHVQRQVADYLVKILAVELAVRIIEDESLRNFQNFASCGKLLPPQSREFLVAGSATTMSGSLSGSETDSRRSRRRDRGRGAANLRSLPLHRQDGR